MKKLEGTIAGLVIAAALWAQPASAMKADCTRHYEKDVWICAEMGSFSQRAICGLDAAIDFAGCLRNALLR